MRLQQPEERLQLESRHRHQGRPLPQGEVHHHLHPIDMEEREHRDDAICAADAVRGRRLNQVGDEIAVRQHHALGESRGAARVWQYGDVPGRIDVRVRDRRVRLEQHGEGDPTASLSDDEDVLDPDLRGRRRRAVQERRHRDQEASPGVAQLVLRVLHGRQGVHGGHHAARCERANECDCQEQWLNH